MLITQIVLDLEKEFNLGTRTQWTAVYWKQMCEIPSSATAGISQEFLALRCSFNFLISTVNNIDLNHRLHSCWKRWESLLCFFSNQYTEYIWQHCTPSTLIWLRRFGNRITICNIIIIYLCPSEKHWISPCIRDIHLTVFLNSLQRVQGVNKNSISPRKIASV